MPFKDNRQFIEALIKSEDIKIIKEEVDWDLEVGAFVRRVNETLGPALLFENISDYPGHKIFASPVTTQRRLAISLGLSSETPLEEIQRIYEARISHPLKPLLLSNAPCKEEVFLDDKVNLFHFPAPLVHGGDGARYIGTWHAVIVKDPDSDWLNWGMYRVMVYNKNLVSISFQRNKDGGRLLYEKYWARGKSMPVAIAIGIDPISSMVSATPFSTGRSEVEIAGSLIEKPIELVKAETSNLLVPAFAEIIVEGEVPPNKMLLSGPFGEHLGYRTEMRPAPLCRVKAITCRHNPILTMSCIGIPRGEGDIGPALVESMELKNALRNHGVPVSEVYLPPEGSKFTVVVSLKRGHGINNIATQVKNIVRSVGHGRPDKIIVVDDDVDVYNIAEVFHALATKCHPLRGIKIENREIASGLTPYLSPEERELGEGSTILFDCTWPSGWSENIDIPTRVSFRDDYPAKIQKSVLQKLKKYGLS